MLVTYIRASVELYNWKNREQVHKIYGMVKFKKMCVLTTENSRNLGIHQIIKIFLVPHSTYMVSGNQDKFVFHDNNYIN